MLANAHAMGGTIRTTLDLAGRLAQHREVEVIALKRRRSRRPFFPFPAGVTVTVLDDRGRARGRAERLLAALPSVLTHPEDYGYRAASLWTDVQLLRRLRGAGGDVVLATRPAWALLATAAAPPDAVVVAQEHLNFHAHRPALAADVRRRYGDLDALVVLTEGDRADYAGLVRPRRADPEPDAALARRALGARRAGRRGGRPARHPEGLRPADPRLRAARPPPPAVDAAHPRRRARARRTANG